MRSSSSSKILLIAIVILVIPALAFALSASKVTLNFMCPCGTCDEALSTCECPQSDGFRSQIAGMVGKGYTEEQVIQDFRGRYGPDVLIANAALAPNSEGLLSKAPSKKTIGVILLLASFSLVAFSLGKYMKAAPSPSSARRKPAKRSRPVRSSPEKDRWWEDRSSDSDEEGFLDDHEI